MSVGATYLFRYKAKNVHGWSTYRSGTLSLVAAKVSDALATISTSNEGMLVKKKWAALAYNGGSNVIGYRIKILDQSNSLVESITYCNGLDPTIRANKYCYIPMTSLTACPFQLPLSNIALAQVEALTVVGYSDPLPS